MIQGGWSWVAAAYGVTWAGLGLYVLSLARALAREEAGQSERCPKPPYRQ